MQPSVNKRRTETGEKYFAGFGPFTFLVSYNQFFLQEAEHDTAFSCVKSSVMVYYEHLVRYSTNLAGSEL